MNNLEYAQLRLRFFRDLNPDQRMQLMNKIGLIPDGYDTPLNHGIEEMMLRHLKEHGRLDELREEINAILY